MNISSNRTVARADAAAPHASVPHSAFLRDAAKACATGLSADIVCMKTRGLSGVARAGVLLLVGSGLVCEAGRVLGRDHGAGPSVRGMPQGLPRRLLGAAQSEAYYTSCAPGPGPVVAMSSPANPGGVTVVGGPPYDPSAINFANGVSTGSQSPASLAGPAQGQCSAGWNAAWVAARLPLPGFDPWPPTRTIHPLTIADLPPNPQIDCGPNVLVPAVAGCLRGPTPECCATLQVLFSEETRLPSRNCLCVPQVAQQAYLQGASQNTNLIAVWEACYATYQVDFFWFTQQGGMCPL